MPVNYYFINSYLYTPKTFIVINHCNHIFWLSTQKATEEK